MLDNLIRKIPKTLLAVVCISVAIAYLIISDPPHKFCDTQIDHFKSKVQAQLSLNKLLGVCRKTVSPGACYEYFASLKQLLNNFNLVSVECLTKNLNQVTEAKSYLLNGINIMVLLAWREEILVGKVDKFNWLSPSDMSLLCEMKEKIILFYGSEYFTAFEAKVLSGLPTPQAVNPIVLKKHSILSENCVKYP